MRQLENEIDAKLVAFSKLGNNLISTHSNLDTVPLLNEEHVFENMGSEIETLIARLKLMNEKLDEIHPNGAAMLHTVQRHKEILKDYKLEFGKIKNNYIAKKTREDLFETTLTEKDAKAIHGLNRRDMFLKENEHIHNSNRLINDQISIAMEARDNLMFQRHSFKRIQTRFNDVSNRFPAFNSLVQRINFRKRRDSLILGVLVGFCTLLILLYTLY